MLCSEEELKIEEKSAGIMILPSEAEIGKDLASALELKDTVLEIELTPNRADCLSIMGIAREVGALLDTPFAIPSVYSEVQEADEHIESYVMVTIEDPQLCPRYTARYVSQVSVGPSPLWLRLRLERSGIRAINNVVDITNYILLEWGQPMHAFDYTLLDQGKIVVKRASDGDTFPTLDEKERVLDGETLMICDASKYIAIGGVMGGLNTEIADSTTIVLLESAYFNPHNIRRTSRKLGLVSESSSRFEKGVNPETVIPALNRAAHLISKLAGGRVTRGIIDAYPTPIQSLPMITVNPKKVTTVLGVDIPAKQTSRYFDRLGISVKAGDNETLVATPPPYRRDLKEDIDLIEEVARIHGYENIPLTLPNMDVPDDAGKHHFGREQKIRSVLANSGFFEVITYSFVSPKDIEALNVPPEHPLQHYLTLANPLSQDQSIMRTSLIPGLLLSAAQNHNHNNTDLKLFELGRVFLATMGKQLPQEQLMLGGLACGHRTQESWNQPDEDVDFFDLKGTIESLFQELLVSDVSFQANNHIPYLHPGIAAKISVKGDPVGSIGEVHPHVIDNFEISKKIVVFEIDFGKIINYCDFMGKQAKPLPKFPAVYRDIALITGSETESQTIEREIADVDVKFLNDIRVFDIYEGENIPSGKKSLAYRMKFQAPNRSLTDEEVNKYYEKIVARLTKTLDVYLRT
jgi:phenylalanyl-tRNA synthetase beta chain